MENLPLIFSILSLVVSFSTMIIYFFQAKEMRKQNLQLSFANEANSFKTAVDILQAEDTREARRIVLAELSNKDFKDWLPIEIKSAEKVCQTYDTVGIMIRSGLLRVEKIADSWGDSLRRTHKILKPMIDSYRAKRMSNEYWDDYEWLANEAETFKERLK